LQHNTTFILPFAHWSTTRDRPFKSRC